MRGKRPNVDNDTRTKDDVCTSRQDTHTRAMEGHRMTIVY
jgi:hypothetical protein